jgi:hypothetical protein
MGIYREAAERIEESVFACHAIHDALGVARCMRAPESDAFYDLFSPWDRCRGAWSVEWLTNEDFDTLPNEEIDAALKGYRILALLLMDAIAESEK